MKSTKRVERHRENAKADGWVRKEYRIRDWMHPLIVKLISKLTKREQK